MALRSGDSDYLSIFRNVKILLFLLLFISIYLLLDHYNAMKDQNDMWIFGYFSFTINYSNECHVVFLSSEQQDFIDLRIKYSAMCLCSSTFVYL